jgi:hypothetical protein
VERHSPVDYSVIEEIDSSNLNLEIINTSPPSYPGIKNEKNFEIKRPSNLTIVEVNKAVIDEKPPSKDNFSYQSFLKKKSEVSFNSNYSTSFQSTVASSKLKNPPFSYLSNFSRKKSSISSLSTPKRVSTSSSVRSVSSISSYPGDKSSQNFEQPSSHISNNNIRESNFNNLNLTGLLYRIYLYFVIKFRCFC